MNTADRNAVLRRIAEQHGTPFYAFFLDQIRDRIDAVRAAFGGRFGVSFAVKSNPAASLLAALRTHCDALDVSSGGEVEAAIAAGWPGTSLSFTGPGKTRSELALAVQHLAASGVSGGEVVLESVDEARVLAGLLRQAERKMRVLVRISPAAVPAGFGDTMSGKPTAFGIDEEELEPALRALTEYEDVLTVVGFHAYSGTQCLKAAAVVENYRILSDVFTRASQLKGAAPEKLIFGSGLGIVYHDGQEPLDLRTIGSETVPVLDELSARFPGVKLYLESGRYLVGEAGVLVTRILRTKHSRGARIGICDSGINHNLAASGMFGMAIRRNYRMSNITSEEAPSGLFQLSGPLCTSIDVLARNIPLSRVETGDLIAVEASGAYGATASLGRFISHPAVSEWLVDGDRVLPARGEW